jgi:hypothetical protein
LPDKPKRAQSNVRFDDHVQAYSNSNFGGSSDQQSQRSTTPRMSDSGYTGAAGGYDLSLGQNISFQSSADGEVPSPPVPQMSESERLYVKYYKSSLQKAHSTLLSNRSSGSGGTSGRSASYNVANGNVQYRCCPSSSAAAAAAAVQSRLLNQSCASIDSGISYNPSNNNVSYNNTYLGIYK